MKISRRQLLIGSAACAAAVPLVALSRPNDGNLIKVEWEPMKVKLARVTTKEPVDCWTGRLFINGELVKGTILVWDSGSVEQMNSELMRAESLFKQELHRILRTSEYDPVIDNSTSDFYYE